MMLDDSEEVFTCKHCGKEIWTRQTYQDVSDEFVDDFGFRIPVKELVTVCVDCFNKWVDKLNRSLQDD